jgi:Cft2 family RNA processing exonuclease
MWLKPNWPAALLLSVHRERIARQLATDSDLRDEVRGRLRLPSAQVDRMVRANVVDDAAAAEALATALASTEDPRAVLEAASVDPDERVACAATPYLLRALPLPVAVAKDVAPAEDRMRTDAVECDRQAARREQAAIRDLRRQLRDEVARSVALERQVARLSDELASAHEDAAGLRRKLPTNKERRALAKAVDSAARTEGLKRQLSQERRGRQADRLQFQARLETLEAALRQAHEDRDSEQRGRRRLENELGDASERSRRLRPLVMREASDLDKFAEAQPNGKERTRALRRAGRLKQLASDLADLYPSQLDGVADAATGSAADPSPESPEPRTSQWTSALTSSRSPRVTALGGASHIGGSALLIEAGSTRVLVDAGLRPDANIGSPGPEHIADAVGGPLDAIVITHAHADHAGFVPWVVERQRRTPVLCSHETKALLPTVWNDSVRVMNAEASTASVRGDPVNPPYGEAEVIQAEDALQGVGYGQGVTAGEVELTLFKAGHILGAAGLVVRAGDWRVVVTGDIDDRGQASVGPAEIPPRLAHEPDLLVIETTYCDRQHEDRDQEGLGLVRRAEEILAGGGRILIPAFGLGRAQEIALLMSTHMPDVDVLVDGLARNISELYALNGAPEVIRGRVRKVENRARQIRGFHNGVVITTSGMLTGGAAIPWAQAVLPDPQNALFLCGHQDEEAPGRQLEDLASADPEQPRQVQLRDEHGKPVTVDVLASVHRYNLSAHADSVGLTRIIDQVEPKAIMLVHGEAGPQATFRRRLEASGYTVVDNRETWDPSEAIPDGRLTRWRHASKVRQRRIR